MSTGTHLCRSCLWVQCEHLPQRAFHAGVEHCEQTSPSFPRRLLVGYLRPAPRRVTNTQPDVLKSCLNRWSFLPQAPVANHLNSNPYSIAALRTYTFINCVLWISKLAFVIVETVMVSTTTIRVAFVECLLYKRHWAKYTLRI